MHIFFKYFFLACFSLNIFSSPWFNIDDNEVISIRNNLIYKCNLKNTFLDTSPTSLYNLEILISKINLKEAPDDCISIINNIKNKFYKKFEQGYAKVGFQTKADNFYLQQRGERLLKDNNIYFDYSSISDAVAFRFKATKSSTETIFDESYVAINIDNKRILKAGKYSRWWSLSNDTSLILSNSARPFYSISLSNYAPIKANYSIFKLLGYYDYEVFIGKLERDRHIPNALLFGNRFSFSPSDRIRLSLMRVAQFGGKGRIVNSETIKNMILGQDTTNRNLGYIEQPGNQIAGIELNIGALKNNNLNFYIQYFGEDGLDPIIDDRWIGAIFPSKRFSLAGLSFKSYDDHPYVISLEHANTDSGYKNTTYNHGLYKDGYRYKKLPIGASIDGDSHKTLISFEKFFVNSSLKLQYQDMLLNQNNSVYSRWDASKIKNKELRVSYSNSLKKGIKIYLEIVHRKINTNLYDKSNLIIKIEKSF